MTHYCISDHCRWVRGSSGSAIYDLKKGEVYAINPDGTAVLEKILAGADVPEGSAAFVDSLAERYLLNNHDTPIVENRIPPRFRYVWLELTGGCNCRCLHCYGAFGSPGKKDLQNELTVDEWKDMMDRITAMGGDSLQFIGGEPLIHPHFCELLSYAHQVGFKRIDIFTNAYLLTEEMADLIAEVGASVRVSLYGCDAQTHDAITQHPGSFARLDRSLDILKARDIPVAIAVVLMRENQDILPQIREYIERKGLQYNGFDTVRTVKHSVQNSHAVTRRDITAQRIMHQPHFTTSPFAFSCNRQWNSCWYGKLAITSRGDVIPCIFARDLVCGNVRTDPLESIREKLLGYWRITKDQVEGCSACEFRYACDDCRPLAMGDGDGLLGKYPRCTYLPGSCQWQDP